MNRELRLRFLKALVNVPLRLADRLLPEAPAPRFPQTQILQRVYSQLAKVYKLECYQGTFGIKPDGNFERLLRVSLKILAGISENDRYYRAWLGLTILLVESDLSAMDRTPSTLRRLIREQWLLDFDFLPDEDFLECPGEFVEVALCDYLGNLARMELSDVSLQRNAKQKMEEKD